MDEITFRYITFTMAAGMHVLHDIAIKLPLFYTYHALIEGIYS